MSNSVILDENNNVVLNDGYAMSIDKADIVQDLNDTRIDAVPSQIAVKNALNNKANKTGGNTFINTQIFNNAVRIKGNASSHNFATKGVVGLADDGTNFGELYLNFNVNSPVKFGKSANSWVNADGSIVENKQKLSDKYESKKQLATVKEIEIKQGTGSSTTDLMSQKAITDILNAKLNKSGGKMTGPVSFANSTALPEKTLGYVCGIDGFDKGGQMGWQSASNFIASATSKGIKELETSKNLNKDYGAYGDFFTVRVNKGTANRPPGVDYGQSFFVRNSGSERIEFLFCIVGSGSLWYRYSANYASFGNWYKLF